MPSSINGQKWGLDSIKDATVKAAINAILVFETEIGEYDHEVIFYGNHPDMYPEGEFVGLVVYEGGLDALSFKIANRVITSKLINSIGA
jgi:hypothetical protein